MRPLLRILAICMLGAASVTGTGAGQEALVLANHNAVVQIEAGWFVMGTDAEDLKAAAELCNLAGKTSSECAELFRDEQPAHRVYLSRYRIDRTEVSRRAYRRCVLANACPPSRIPDSDPNLGNPDFPVTGVTWAEARRYCHWMGGDLPTEAQWERAARGAAKWLFPWGRQYDRKMANHGSARGGGDAEDGFLYAAPVAGFGRSKNAYGLLNMAGNAWEFVRDRYGSDYYRHCPSVNPVNLANGERRVIRGGSWQSAVYTLRSSARAQAGESDNRPDLGFRCGYDAP